MPANTMTARTAHWLWPPLLLLGCLIVVIAWLLIALASGRQSGWVAPLAALEISWLLRVGTLRAGRWRQALALGATLATIVIANWGIAAAQIGGAMGLDAWTSLLRMGAGYAWTLSLLANHTLDWSCYGLALLLALWNRR